MDGTTLYPIGELARRTGIPVTTIRYYADADVVAPTSRNASGYRLYGLDAVHRLELVRTLRELGIDLATVRRVLTGGLSVAEVAAAHADALEIQIRTLRLRQSVLRVVAGRGSSSEETTTMHRLTKLTAEERRRLIEEFLAETFAEPGATAVLRTAIPSLPDDPSDEQVAAWTELAELIGDENLRSAMRRTTPYQSGRHTLAIESGVGEELTDYTRQKVAEARESGVDPLSERAVPVVEDLVRRHASALGRNPDAAFRKWMAEQFAQAHDPQVERYWRLVWAVNGWEVVPGLLPVYPWLIIALCGEAIAEVAPLR